MWFRQLAVWAGAQLAFSVLIHVFAARCSRTGQQLGGVHVPLGVFSGWHSQLAGVMGVTVNPTRFLETDFQGHNLKVSRNNKEVQTSASKQLLSFHESCLPVSYWTAQVTWQSPHTHGVFPGHRQKWLLSQCCATLSVLWWFSAETLFS